MFMSTLIKLARVPVHAQIRKTSPVGAAIVQAEKSSLHLFTPKREHPHSLLRLDLVA